MKSFLVSLPLLLASAANENPDTNVSDTFGVLGRTIALADIFQHPEERQIGETVQNLGVIKAVEWEDQALVFKLNNGAREVITVKVSTRAGH